MNDNNRQDIVYKIASFNAEDGNLADVSVQEKAALSSSENSNDEGIEKIKEGEDLLNGEIIIRADEGDESSMILQRLFFKGGKLNGRCEFYDPGTGSLESVIEYRDDKIHGLFEQFDNGKLINRLHFADGELSGVCESYAVISDGGADSGIDSDSDSGNNNDHDTFLELRANFSEGLLSGPIQIYNDKDSLYLQAGFADNKLHGKMFIFNSDGSKQLEMQFRDNKLDGEMITYLDGEKPINKTEFHDNKIHGEMVTFNENGGISSYQHYYADKMQGEWKVYFDNGKLMEHGSYNQNKKHGTFTNYHLNGMPSRLTHYDNGKLIDLPMMFDRHGKEIETDDE